MSGFFDSGARYIMEKRTPDGTLDFSDPQPPFLECNERQITEYYFRHVTDGESATQEAIIAWYQARGWTWRRKTW